MKQKTVIIVTIAILTILLIILILSSNLQMSNIEENKKEFIPNNQLNNNSIKKYKEGIISDINIDFNNNNNNNNSLKSNSKIDQRLIDNIQKDENYKEFIKWYNQYNKEKDYDLNSEEGIKRFEAFKANLEMINEHNNKQTNQMFSMGLNPYSDLDYVEFRKRVMGKNNN